MKILITGCRGQLGRELIRLLGTTWSEYDVVATDIHNLDITNRQQVLDCTESFKFDVIINCAAYTNVDKCETDEENAFKVNAIGAQNLSIASSKVGARMVHLSTDYVFDGTVNSPRREYDAINPQNVYGKSKALGEQLVERANQKHYIIRTAWLYGEGNNFVNTMLSLSKQKKEISVVTDQVGTPTSTKDVAKCIMNLLHTDNYGIYHATCEGMCSWYDFAKKIFDLRHIPISLRKITTEQLNRPAQRPKYTVLDNFMLKMLELNTFRDWEEALKEYLETYQY